jgi:hypothetical protein
MGRIRLPGMLLWRGASSLSKTILLFITTTIIIIVIIAGIYLNDWILNL